MSFAGFPALATIMTIPKEENMVPRCLMMTALQIKVISELLKVAGTVMECYHFGSERKIY